MSLSTIITGAAIDMGKKFLFENGKKIAHEFGESALGKKAGVIISYRKEEHNNNVLLFVHGFSGNSAETFGATPDILVNEKDFKGWDVFSIGYSTDIFPAIGKGLWSVNPDINKISAYLNTLLQNQFEDYDRIAFVGHSMGGLAIQRAILNTKPDVRQKISHVMFFGTPSAGLKKAGWVNFWNRQLRDLDQDSEFIKNLRTDWNNLYQQGMPFVLKTIAGSKDEFVPVTSSLDPFNEDTRGVIEGNHITMVKPAGITDINSQSFQLILHTLTGQHIEYVQGEAGDINLLLGHYHAVINKYLPNAKDIVVKYLIQLVFALECTGRGEEALRVLNEHPDASNNSDVMGIIGGRYKRKFLLSGLKADLNNASEYYKKGLDIAENANDNKQVFYHAINLAFLSIFAEGNSANMKKYAQQALDNCTSADKDKWELATIAEANLYLGNTDLALDYYQQSGALADSRDKESIYSNAYNGYQSLKSGNTNNSPFIEKLDAIFMKR